MDAGKRAAARCAVDTYVKVSFMKLVPLSEASRSCFRMEMLLSL